MPLKASAAAAWLMAALKTMVQPLPLRPLHIVLVELLLAEVVGGDLP